MSKRNSKVSVVIILYNSEIYIEGCLRSLINQTYKNIETIIVDNASNEDPKNKIKLLLGESDYIYIKNNKNVGYAIGNNIGIERSNGKYVLLLNQDVLLENDYIEKAINLFEDDHNIGSITGKILKFKYDNGNIVKTNIIDSKGLKIYKSNRVIEIDANNKDETLSKEKDQEIFGVSAAAGIYRKDALDKIKEISFIKNYFDDKFFMYKEDIDLAWRLKHAGWTSNYLNSARAYHDRWATGSSSKNTKVISGRKAKSDIVNYYSYRNHFLLVLKNQFLQNIILYLPLIFLYELQKFTYLLLFEQKTLKGLIDFIKLVPLTLRKRNAILSKSKLKPSELRRWF